MKSTTRSLASVAVALLPALVSAAKCKPWVDSELLQGLTKIEDLVAGSQKLQDIADANGNNRAFGGGGHNATVDWLVESLEALDYYDVVKQPFTELFAAATGGLTVAGAPVEGNIMTYTSGTAGPVTAPLVNVANVGCEAADYPATVSGNIAFVSRGTCSFAIKSTNAKAAGALGVVVYNNAPGALSGTLGEPFGSYAPAIGISQEAGQAILAQLAAGEVSAVLDIDAVVEERVSYNVIAETKEGDHDNVLVLGGHSDSVAAGPGINDDGSGIVGVLNVAQNLAKFRVHNAVRFAFWSAEEFGLLGSYFYINSVNGSDTELAKIRAYLNFDMIASPNFMYGIYDGDGSDFGLTGPAGSDVIERDFEEFYEDKGLNHVATEFSGRSDYAAFIENGIPSGGIFTGAEGLKTEAEAALFGGEAGVAYDINYHKRGDDINNLNLDAYLVNTQSIAHTVAKYALSFDSLAPVDLSKRHWDGDRAKFTKRASEDAHVHAGPCGGGVRK